MDTGQWISHLKKTGRLRIFKKQVKTHLELSALMAACDTQPVWIEKTDGAGGAMPVAGNLYPTRAMVAEAIGTTPEKLAGVLQNAIENPKEPKEADAEAAPFLSHSSTPDLSALPVPFYYPKDGGRYLSSAVVFAKDREYGQNASFHRMMVLGKDKMVARILQRHLDTFLTRAGGELEVAICMGLPAHVLLASAVSTEIGVDEMGIANALAPVERVKLPNGIWVPTDSQIVWEAKITSEMADEGPFVDLTDTYDVVRKQRVVKLTKQHVKPGAFFHCLRPSGGEHKVLMGLPREPTVMSEVNKVVECTGARVTPGGCSWLHVALGIRKKSEEDGKRAIEAAFRGHASCKLVSVYDADIDLDDPAAMEWAMATRFQAGRGVVVKLEQKGSSLDPSADPNTRLTSKMGIDATRPLVVHGKDFTRASYPKVTPEDFE